MGTVAEWDRPARCSQSGHCLSTVATNMLTVRASASYLGQPQVDRAIRGNTFLPSQETAKNMPGMGLSLDRLP